MLYVFLFCLVFFITCFLAALTECYLVTWNRLYKWIRTSVTHRREGRRRDHRCILITGRHFKCFTKKGWNFLSQHILQKGHMSIYTFSRWQTYTLRVYTAQHPPPLFFLFFFSSKNNSHIYIWEHVTGVWKGQGGITVVPFTDTVKDRMWVEVNWVREQRTHLCPSA